MLLMAYNTYRTIAEGKAVDAEIPAVSQTQHH
jgi:cytochrome c oxidase cbb3-type subunit 1